MVANGEDKADAICRLKEDTSLDTEFPSSL